MKLYQFVTSQSIFFSIIFFILKSSDNYYITNFLENIKNIPWLRVGSLNGLILCSIFLMFLNFSFFDWLYSQLCALAATRKYALNIKKAKSLLFYNTMFYFIFFITAYIFKMLTYRIYNLFAISFIFIYLNVIGKALNFKIFVVAGFFGFFLCFVIVGLHIFITPFENIYSLIIRFIN